MDTNADINVKSAAESLDKTIDAFLAKRREEAWQKFLAEPQSIAFFSAIGPHHGEAVALLRAAFETGEGFGVKGANLGTMLAIKVATSLVETAKREDALFHFAADRGGSMMN